MSSVTSNKGLIVIVQGGGGGGQVLQRGGGEMFLFLTTLASTLAFLLPSNASATEEQTFRAAVYEHLITEPSECKERVCTRSG